MIEYVRRLGAKRGIVLRNRGDRGLERLLSELFRAMRDAFVEQRARIGFLGARLGALRDQPGKVVERKHFIHGDNAVIAMDEMFTLDDLSRLIAQRAEAS